MLKVSSAIVLNIIANFDNARSFSKVCAGQMEFSAQCADLTATKACGVLKRIIAGPWIVQASRPLP